MTINYPALSEFDFLVKYLEITNMLLEPAQRLTLGEMELVAAITSLPEEKYKYQRFSTGAKRRVSEQLGITMQNINNRVHALATKNFLRRDEDKVLYLPKHILAVFEEFKKGEVTLTFKLPNDNLKNKRPSAKSSTGT